VRSEIVRDSVPRVDSRKLCTARVVGMNETCNLERTECEQVPSQYSSGVSCEEIVIMDLYIHVYRI
jgi:hypothetical protein